MTDNITTNSYNTQRELAIKAWNAGIAIKKQINQKYGKIKAEVAQDFVTALNSMINIVYESGQANTINRALAIIVADDEFRNRCDGFPKTVRNLSNYVDQENARRILVYKRPMQIEEHRSQDLEHSSNSINEDQPTSDQEIFTSQGIDIRPYNTWRFEHDKSFGLDHPGKIPAGIVLNTLYFYTQPGDLVVDPMAGGGTVGDCCHEVKRKCLMYDVNPIRGDINPHDIRKGIPEEAHNAKLLFWDPPYYKKKLNEYGPQSISAMDRTQYLDVFRQVASDSYHAGIQRIALVMSDYISQDGNGDPSDNIFIWDYVDIFKAQHWNPVNHIFCQLTMQQIDARTIIKFRREKLFAVLSRSLVIFDRID